MDYVDYMNGSFLPYNSQRLWGYSNYLKSLKKLDCAKIIIVRVLSPLHNNLWKHCLCLNILFSSCWYSTGLITSRATTVIRCTQRGLTASDGWCLSSLSSGSLSTPSTGCVKNMTAMYCKYVTPNNHFVDMHLWLRRSFLTMTLI